MIKRNQRRGGVGQPGILPEKNRLLPAQPSAGTRRHRLSFVNGGNIFTTVHRVIEQILQIRAGHSEKKIKPLFFHCFPEFSGFYHLPPSSNSSLCLFPRRLLRS